MCAQPCRKPYTLVQGETDENGRPTDLADVSLKEQYLLSPRDLCTYEHLPELVSSPVVSLKIEGRMKSPEYVAIVVSTYRQGARCDRGRDMEAIPKKRTATSSLRSTGTSPRATSSGSGMRT